MYVSTLQLRALQNRLHDMQCLIPTGPSSIAIPGELRVMEVALTNFSENSPETRQTLFADAIKYAEEGFLANKHLADAVRKVVVDDPSDNTAHSFKDKQSQPWFQELK